MKTNKALVLKSIILSMFMLGCSNDDAFIPEIEEQEKPIEEPVDENFYYPTPDDVSSYLVDQSATPETIALFYNLKINSQKGFIVGQQDAFSSFYQNEGGESDMKKLTGSDPGILGSDFIFITDDQNNGQASNWFYQQELNVTQDAISAYNKGMVNAFTWHFREPYEGKSFYTSDMSDFQKNNAFKSILPDGENHEYYKEKLQKIAQVANNLKGEDGELIPFIFRPFHEFDGDFFWWGAAYSTPQEFKRVWQFTVTYLRDELNVHNILYAYAPDNSYTTQEAYLERYPGDEYVDILAMDNYYDLSNQQGSGVDLANSKLKVVSDLALEKVKIAGLSETGYFVDSNENTYISPVFYSSYLYDVLTANEVEVGFMMFWLNSGSTYTVPVPGTAGADDFINFDEQERTLLLQEINNMYTISK
tara:strand:- start:5892 stop:7148 length:1257 start_codon:yes stop_codon:yes gene_type:complete